MRKLASIQRVAEIKPIEGADKICAYRVNGWWVVDKVGKYKVDDAVVYFEVDSFIPNYIAAFLSKGKEPSVYEEVQGERLRTIKLRKQISQGLIMHPSEIPDFIHVYYNASDRHTLRKYTYNDVYIEYEEGDDLSEALGIIKWEPKLPAQLSGQVRGLFPSEIPKTDQERVQNIDIEQYHGETYEVTEKLHGSSCTFYLDKDGDFHVCSRNYDLKPDQNNAYWKAAIKYNAEEQMKRLGLYGYAVQGELCGEGINGNNYKLGLDFFVFDVYQVGVGYWLPNPRRDMTRKLGLKHVPVVDSEYLLYDTKDALLDKADGKSVLADCKREGFVFKSHESDRTFKVVSNDWLLKYE